jgi:LacI family transcriptional regulator
VEKEILVSPIRVVTRRSTDIVAVDDPVLAAALRFIRENAGCRITVERILDHLAATTKSVSRSWLEHRFKDVLNRSPKDEILSVLTANITNLLLETNWSLEKIAEKVGLRSAPQLSTLFRRRTGHTPGEFRNSVRTNSPFREMADGGLLASSRGESHGRIAVKSPKD